MCNMGTFLSYLWVCMVLWTVASAVTVPSCDGGNSWTGFFDRDDPGGKCDCEYFENLRKKSPEQICDNPLAVDARVVSTHEDYRLTGQNVTIATEEEKGFICMNKDNKDKCKDYEVRFCCDNCGADAQSEKLHDFDMICSSGCQNETKQVWGTGTYTSDSSICRAAIHDGVITDSGGLVSVYKVKGVVNFVGSTQNGVISSSCSTAKTHFSSSDCSTQTGFFFNGTAMNSSIICEGSNSTIKCPHGQHINVSSACYGRNDPNTCVKEKGKCKGETNVLSTVGPMCNGKPSCTLSATNDAFGDPCQHVHKYLNVTYSCENQGIATTPTATSTTGNAYSTALTPTSRQPDTTASEASSQSTEPLSSQQPTTTLEQTNAQTSSTADKDDNLVTWLAIALASGAVAMGVCIVLAFWYFRRSKRQQQLAKSGTANSRNVSNEKETVDNVLYSSFGNGINSNTTNASSFASDGNERETVDNPIYAHSGNISEKEEVDNILYGVSKVDDQKIEVDNILYGVSTG